jgi:hypothetical protein
VIKCPNHIKKTSLARTFCEIVAGQQGRPFLTLKKEKSIPLFTGITFLFVQTLTLVYSWEFQLISLYFIKDHVQ